MLKQFLKQISVNNITLMADVNKDFFIDKSGKSNYYVHNNFEMEYFSNFVNNLDSNALYSVIPLISVKKNLNEPYLVLSNTMLVTKYSSYREIHHYVYENYLQSIDDFGMDHLEDYNLVFKYKRVKIDINQIKRRFK
jgi:hypothetical protein